MMMMICNRGSPNSYQSSPFSHNFDYLYKKMYQNSLPPLPMMTTTTTATAATTTTTTATTLAVRSSRSCSLAFQQHQRN